MFIEKISETLTNEKVNLAFIKSLNIKAFPCGRRRSTLLDDNVSRIPFDPESRLNTEANNLKHSGVNGFTDTYISLWDDKDGILTISVGGYLFSIDLGKDNEYTTPQLLGSKFANYIMDDASVVSSVDNIYVNVLIEDNNITV